MNKRRLLKLADLLVRDARRKHGIKFDLQTWGQVTDAASPVSCSTQACAMGLAALSGEFKRAGLGYTIDYFNQINITFRGGYGAINAAMKTFGINRDQAEWLFVPAYYRGLPKTGADGERAVARRIRDFVAGKVSP